MPFEELFNCLWPKDVADSSLDIEAPLGVAGVGVGPEHVVDKVVGFVFEGSFELVDALESSQERTDASVDTEYSLSHYCCDWQVVEHVGY